MIYLANAVIASFDKRRCSGTSGRSPICDRYIATLSTPQNLHECLIHTLFITDSKVSFVFRSTEGTMKHIHIKNEKKSITIYQI